MARGSQPGERRGGRQKGARNKATTAKAKAIAASGLTPLDWMLSVLRDPTIDYDRRDKAARDAAPYVHPRLASTELSGKDGNPFVIELVRYAKSSPTT
jgi:hypothetical protein